MPTYQQQGSASINIAAAPEVVWSLVADVTRMAQWSPECIRAEWTDGADGPTAGAHFHGYNRQGTLEWDELCLVTECQPGRLFAFEVPCGSPNATQWKFQCVPSATGTTLTESFDAPLINVEGSVANWDGRFEMLVEGIKTTIAEIKATAEQIRH
jgi:hypothetical protein